MTTCGKAIWLSASDVVWCARERNHPNNCAPPSGVRPLVETPRSGSQECPRCHFVFETQDHK